MLALPLGKLLCLDILLQLLQFFRQLPLYVSLAWHTQINLQQSPLSTS